MIGFNVECGTWSRTVRLIVILVLCSGSQAQTTRMGMALKTIATFPIGTESHRVQISRVTVSPDLEHMSIIKRTWVGDEPTDTLDTYKVATGKELPQFSSPDEIPESAMYSPDGRLLSMVTATRNMQRTLRVFELLTGKKIYTSMSGTHGITPCAFTPDSKRLLLPFNELIGDRFSFQLIDLSNGEIKSQFDPGREQLAFGMFEEIQFSSGADYIVTRQDDYVLAWDVHTQRMTLRWQWDGNGGIAAIRCVPDSKNVRIVCQDGTVITCDMAISKETARLRLDLPPLDPKMPKESPLSTPWSLHNVAFSEDAAIIYEGERGRIVSWDATTGRKAAILELKSKEATPLMQSLVHDSVAAKLGDHDSDVQIVQLVPVPEK